MDKEIKIDETINMKQEPKKESENNFLDSISTQCFQCQRRKVIIRWNKPRKKYSEKNNLGYYTEKEEDKEKFLCDKCIFELYYQKKSTY